MKRPKGFVSLADLFRFKGEINIPIHDKDSRSPEFSEYLLKKAEEKRRKRNGKRISNYRRDEA